MIQLVIKAESKMFALGGVSVYTRVQRIYLREDVLDFSEFDSDGGVASMAVLSLIIALAISSDTYASSPSLYASPYLPVGERRKCISSLFLFDMV